MANGTTRQGRVHWVTEYRQKVLGEAARTTKFKDEYAVTLEVSAAQYFPYVRAAAECALAERNLMPARWIRVRKMKEQEADGDLPAFSAAMQIIGASYVETLDTKGTDGSNPTWAARRPSPATSAASASPTSTLYNGWTSSCTTTPITASNRS
jgi:hypothetical protein